MCLLTSTGFCISREKLACELHPDKDDQDGKGLKAKSHAGGPRTPETSKLKKKMLMEQHYQLTYLPLFILYSFTEKNQE